MAGPWPVVHNRVTVYAATVDGPPRTHSGRILVVMGTRTDFIGHLEVHPPLNEAEYSYLTAFAESRRHRGRGGLYVVPDKPPGTYDDDREGVDHDDYNTPPDGQPQLWCPRKLTVRAVVSRG